MKDTPTGNFVHEAFKVDSGYGGFGISFNIKSSYATLINNMPVPPDGDMASLKYFATQGESYLGINLGAFSLFVEYFDL